MQMSFGDNEHTTIPDTAEAVVEMMETSGGRNIQPFTVRSASPITASDAVGVTRMGHNPKKSKLNQFQQSHDIPNLLVQGRSGFTSSACQNSTLTIIALRVRFCDHLMQEMKHGSV